jgi:hypothetical protein
VKIGDVPGRAGGGSGFVLAVLEEPSTASSESHGLDLEARRDRDRRSKPAVMYTGLFEQIKRLGGAVFCGGEDI